MDSVLEIARILAPLIAVGGIAVFVVFRMRYKYEKGTLGKKKSESAQQLLDSLIPLGMLIGSISIFFFNSFFSIPLQIIIILGPGIGLLFGYFAYEIYSKMEEKY